MIVLCTKLVQANSERELERSPWLTVGKRYHVLAIMIEAAKQFYVIESDDNESAILATIDQFTVISNRLPSCWIVVTEIMGYRLSFAPAEWSPQFWSHYNDGDLEAKGLYARIKNMIREEEPL